MDDAGRARTAQVIALQQLLLNSRGCPHKYHAILPSLNCSGLISRKRLALRGRRNRPVKRIIEYGNFGRFAIAMAKRRSFGGRISRTLWRRKSRRSWLLPPCPFGSSQGDFLPFQGVWSEFHQESNVLLSGENVFRPCGVSI